MNEAVKKPITVAARVLYAMALPVVFLGVYSPLATSVWEWKQLGTTTAHAELLALAVAALGACKFWWKPRTVFTWIALVMQILYAGAWTAAPLFQQGRLLSDWESYLILLFFIDVVVMPLTVLLLMMGVLRRERITWTAAGLVYSILAAFAFTDLREHIPWVLDGVSGSHWFSRTARHWDADLYDKLSPDAKEIAGDHSLIKKDRLSIHKVYELDEAAYRSAPEFHCAVLREIMAEFPAVTDFQTQREALRELWRGWNVHGECGRDVLLFHSALMQQNRGAISDEAARFLLSRRGYLTYILNDDGYKPVLEALPRYLQERLATPRKTRADEKSAMEFHNLAFSDIEYDMDKLQAAPASALAGANRANAANLILFLPYLNDLQSSRIVRGKRLADIISTLAALKQKLEENPFPEAAATRPPPAEN